MTLREKRIKFTELLCGLLGWIEGNTEFSVALDEVTVHSPRAARRGVERLSVEDAVHKRGSFHHQGLAADLLLYDAGGGYLTDGNHPVWQVISDKWKSMDPLCTAGIDFQDANHFSYGEGK